MVRDRSDEVTMVENESRVERVQDLFPHDDLQLCEKEKQSVSRKTLIDWISHDWGISPLWLVETLPNAFTS